MKFPNKLKIRVSSKDIASGYKGNTRKCPIANSLNRIGYTAEVGAGNLKDPFSYIIEIIQIVKMPHNYSYTNIIAKYFHSEASLKFANDFDCGKKVKPSTFVLTKKE